METDGQTKQLDNFTGQALKVALDAGTQLLEQYCEAINALNVFPVPDGDTGTNMLLTVKSAAEQTSSVDSESLSKVAGNAARGALLGARGNSGVIFSQFLIGFAESLDSLQACDAQSLASALTKGFEVAYSSISNPVEGTMLTVMRELAFSARQRSTMRGTDVTAIWKASLDGALSALARTPSQLPLLQEAGVVDAGGQAVVVLLEGFYWASKGHSMEDVKIDLHDSNKTNPNEPTTIRQSFLQTEETLDYGYCTQFLIESRSINLDETRKALDGMSNSVVVGGQPSLVRVHVHTFSPDAVLEYCSSIGTISQVKIDDMDEQHQGFLRAHLKDTPECDLSVVAVAWGEGFSNLFKDLGCQAVITCGKTMNPSAQELLEAAQSTGARDVIILPNNPNVRLAAEQACAISQGSITYLPTSTLPQGVAALLAYVPDTPLENAMKTMRSSISEVKTLEITRSARDATISGIGISKGQLFGLLEGTLIAVGESTLDVLQASLLKADLPEGGNVTLYRGNDVTEMEGLTTVDSLRLAFPSHQIEMVYGGQPIYSYIVSIE